MKLPLHEKLRSLPALKCLIPWLAGILSENQFLSGFLLTGLLVLCLGLYVFMLVIHKRTGSDWFWLRGFVFFLLFFLTGSHMQRKEKSAPREDVRGVFLAECMDYPSEKPKTNMIPVKILYCNDSIHREVLGTRAVVYLSKDSGLVYPEPGDRIIFHSVLREPTNNGNPFEFDYAAYLREKGFNYRVFLQSEDWVRSSSGSRSMKYIPVRIRHSIQEFILSRKAGLNEKSVLIAVALGDKSMLDRETRQFYTDAGGIHVMAVSGLHVGMIWMFISWIIKLIPGAKLRVICAFPLTLSVLWTYALVTGLSPSVTRSCLMFSILSLGRLFNRNAPVLNTLAFAAMVQLSIDPEDVHDLGFRFSYLAVAGIVLFQPVLSGLVQTGHNRIDKILDLGFVSISAQALTAPLSIMYFHRFPALFLPVNYIVIPLVTIIMVIFLLSMIFFPVTVFSGFLMDVALRITSWMNMAVEGAGHLPFAVVTGLYLTSLQVMMLFAATFMLLGFWHFRRLWWLILGGIILSLSFWPGITEEKKWSDPDQIVVWNVRDMAVITFASSGEWNLVVDRESTEAKESVEMTIEAYRIQHRLKKPDYFNLGADVSWPEGIIELPGNKNFMLVRKGEKVVILGETICFKNLESQDALELKLLVLCCREGRINEKVFEIFDPQFLVISSAVPAYTRLPSSFNDMDMKVHDVRKDGAFILEMAEKKKMINGIYNSQE